MGNEKKSRQARRSLRLGYSETSVYLQESLERAQARRRKNRLPFSEQPLLNIYPTAAERAMGIYYDPYRTTAIKPEPQFDW